MGLSALQNRALQGYKIYVIEAGAEYQFSDGPPGERGSSADFTDLAEGIQYFLRINPDTRFEWHLLLPKPKKFRVVIWEQRRIEMLFEAKDEDYANAHAMAVWDQIPDNDAVYGISEVVEIDNHDIKSMIVEEASH